MFGLSHNAEFMYSLLNSNWHNGDNVNRYYVDIIFIKS